MPQRVVDAHIAERTQVLGHHMFAAIRASEPWFWQFEWWEARLLAMMMQNDALRRQAFEFIAELPSLETDLAIAQRMRERFGQLGPKDPVHQSNGLADLKPTSSLQVLNQVIGQAVRLGPSDGWWARRLVSFARGLVAMMARRFIAGETLDEAEQAILELRRRQLAFTVDLLGEATRTAEQAREIQATYLELIEELSRASRSWRKRRPCDAGGPAVNVSVKITALYPGFGHPGEADPVGTAVDVLRPLLRAAMQQGALLNIDTEHYAVKDLTIQVCEALFGESEFRNYPHVGMVLQAYLRDGDRDVQRIVNYARRRGTRMWVRLVKGAYWDSEVRTAREAGVPAPVWLEKPQTDACYERMTRVLLNHSEYLSTAIASHNVRSLCHAAAWAEHLNVGAEHFEWQMLYGMGDPMKRAAVRLRRRVRVYTPYGPLMPGIAYFVRRLLENTANESFLRHMHEEGAERALLREPLDRLNEHSCEH
jgi:RHH-type proline utilization regulon transcriptional repressor/proline dehydrogenase/delta 1-pyrroline-5-carboxylate dehydrogenase